MSRFRRSASLSTTPSRSESRLCKSTASSRPVASQIGNDLSNGETATTCLPSLSHSINSTVVALACTTDGSNGLYSQMNNNRLPTMAENPTNGPSVEFSTSAASSDV